jgi:hypothetical protein
MKLNLNIVSFINYNIFWWKIIISIRSEYQIYYIIYIIVLFAQVNVCVKVSLSSSTIHLAYIGTKKRVIDGLTHVWLFN